MKKNVACLQFQFSFDGKGVSLVRRGGFMRKSLIFGAGMAAGLLMSPAFADDKCLIDVPANADAAFFNARIAACTESLGREKDADQRIQLLWARAMSYEGIKSYVRALHDLKDWLALNPNAPEVHFDLADLYGTIGYAALALTEVEDAIRLGDNSGDTYSERASIRASIGQSDGAIADANFALSQDASNSQAYWARGYAEMETGDMAAAVRDFSKVLELVPNDASSYHYRGLALFGLDRYAEALSDFQSAQKNDPEDYSDGYDIASIQPFLAPLPSDMSLPPDTMPRAIGRTHNCSAYYPDLSARLGDQARVIIHYDVLASGTIANVGLERTGGNETLDRAAVACARAHWRSMPALKNGVAVDFHMLAEIQFVMAEPVSALVHARTLADMGRYDDAIAGYTQSLAVKPNDPNAYFQRGFLHYLKEDFAVAISDFNQAIALKPDFDDAKAARELVQAALTAKGGRGTDI